MHAVAIGYKAGGRGGVWERAGETGRGCSGVNDGPVQGVTVIKQ